MFVVPCFILALIVFSCNWSGSLIVKASNPCCIGQHSQVYKQQRLHFNGFGTSLCPSRTENVVGNARMTPTYRVSLVSCPTVAYQEQGLKKLEVIKAMVGVRSWLNYTIVNTDQ